MANEVLKQIFQEMQPQLVSVNPNSIMDALFSKKALSSDDYYELSEVSVSRDRCRKMLSRLHVSPHPQAFIHLRLALLDEYSWIVNQIDKKLPSLASQLQQLHLGQSADGKSLLTMIIYRKIIIC